MLQLTIYWVAIVVTPPLLFAIVLDMYQQMYKKRDYQIVPMPADICHTVLTPPRIVEMVRDAGIDEDEIEVKSRSFVIVYPGHEGPESIGDNSDLITRLSSKSPSTVTTVLRCLTKERVAICRHFDAIILYVEPRGSDSVFDGMFDLGVPYECRFFSLIDALHAVNVQIRQDVLFGYSAENGITYSTRYDHDYETIYSHTLTSVWFSWNKIVLVCDERWEDIAYIGDLADSPEYTDWYTKTVTPEVKRFCESMQIKIIYVSPDMVCKGSMTEDDYVEDTFRYICDHREAADFVRCIFT
jgi:hypothetical protein